MINTNLDLVLHQQIFVAETVLSTLVLFVVTATFQ